MTALVAYLGEFMSQRLGEAPRAAAE